MKTRLPWAFRIRVAERKVTILDFLRTGEFRGNKTLTQFFEIVNYHREYLLSALTFVRLLFARLDR